MKIKVKRRSVIIWNMALFLVLSFLFLHTQIALIREISALNLRLLKLNIFNLKEIILVLSLALFAVFNLKKWSRFLFFIAVATVTGFTIFLLRDHFSKIILVTLGLYLAIAYYFYQFLILELEEPCYNPGFDKGHLFEPMLKKVPVVLYANETRYDGHLTNWNENSCFVFLEKDFPATAQNEFDCEIHFYEKKFKSKAKLTALAKNNQAIGLRFEDDKNEIFNWKNFYKITEQQGITAELIK